MRSPQDKRTDENRFYGLSMGLILGTGIGVPVGVVLMNSTDSAWFMALSVLIGAILGAVAGWLFIGEPES